MVLISIKYNVKFLFLVKIYECLLFVDFFKLN